MFRSTPAPIVEKVVRVKDPLNTQIAKLYADLLEKHNTLLTEHRVLLSKLRETPLYAAPAGERLWLTEDQEDAAEQLRLAPAIPSPWDDDRQDEAELRWASGIANLEAN